MIQLAFASPGCTRALSRMPFSRMSLVTNTATIPLHTLTFRFCRLSGLVAKLVMVRRSTALPAREQHSVFRRTYIHGCTLVYTVAH